MPETPAEDYQEVQGDTKANNYRCQAGSFPDRTEDYCYRNSCKSAIMLSLGYLWCDVMHTQTDLQPEGFRVATIKLEPRIKFNHNIIDHFRILTAGLELT